MLRLRFLRRLILMTAAVVLVSAPTAASAQADEECWRWITVVVGEDENGDPVFGPKLVNICEAPGDDGSDSGQNTCRHSTLGTVPCVDPVMGWWSHTEDCYVSLLSPQPSAGDPLWEGNHPDDGTVYQFHCWAGDPGTWRPSAEFRAVAPEEPSVVELAQEAIRKLPLPGAQIGIAPDPSGVGLVGVPVWMWTEDTDATWRPDPVSASIPGVVTVTAQARATEIAWAMGDGHTEVCDSPGTPYEPRYGGQESPTCGHLYSQPSRSQPDGRFPVTATTTWHVEWWVEPRGSGASGDDWFFRESATSVRINELQVVTS